jgi:hypothetical protein
MNKIVKITLLTILVNVVVALLWIVPANYPNNENSLAWVLTGFTISGITLPEQVVVGIVFAAGNSKKEMGKGLLLATGICMLIGLSYCGALMIQ